MYYAYYLAINIFANRSEQCNRYTYYYYYYYYYRVILKKNN